MIRLLTEDENKQSGKDSSADKCAVVEVSNVPSGCTREKLIMILENKRYTEVRGAEVVSVEFDNGDPRIALVKFSSTEG